MRRAWLSNCLWGAIITIEVMSLQRSSGDTILNFSELRMVSPELKRDPASALEQSTSMTSVFPPRARGRQGRCFA